MLSNKTILRLFKLRDELRKPITTKGEYSWGYRTASTSAADSLDEILEDCVSTEIGIAESNPEVHRAGSPGSDASAC